MDELIDIVTEHGESTGRSALKSIIHQKGYYHNTAHIWFYTLDNKILLSQRAASKVICPLLWDVSIAGHIDSGESIIEGAIRETKEEIGIDINENDLKKIGVFKCTQSYDNTIFDNEFHHTFISILKVPLSKLIPQEDEVAALKLVSFDKFQALINHIGNDNHFVPSNKDYYQSVLQNIIHASKSS
ncbi:NUDIX hydrolase [Changchengzhania lutea]|uniref:NUDIX hydrolase n=1 Tax=Changchengzhania lutea TaxID=2049305 RepID=UPI00115D746A|nr:NUDIX domain-containing protein [Changchengzhania lutea]